MTRHYVIRNMFALRYSVNVSYITSYMVRRAEARNGATRRDTAWYGAAWKQARQARHVLAVACFICSLVIQ